MNHQKILESRAAHEAAHVLMALLTGIKVNRIDMFASGDTSASIEVFIKNNCLLKNILLCLSAGCASDLNYFDYWTAIERSQYDRDDLKFYHSKQYFKYGFWRCLKSEICFAYGVWLNKQFLKTYQEAHLKLTQLLVENDGKSIYPAEFHALLNSANFPIHPNVRIDV